MKGMAFVEIIEGRMVSQGLIQSEAGEGHWVVKFFGQPPVSRVVPVENMKAMQLFDSMRDMDEWIKANSTQPEKSGDAGTTEGVDPDQSLVPTDELTDEQRAAMADKKPEANSKANGAGRGKKNGPKKGTKKTVNKQSRPAS